MQYPSVRSMLIAISSLMIFSLAPVASGADDLLAQAAARFRNKAFEETVVLARKAGDSPQRTFLLGVTLLRAGKAAEAVPLLVEAELKLPLLADYAVLYQAEALLKLKKYPEASGKAVSVAKGYPASLLIRRSEKLNADILFEAGDYSAALKVYQGFVEKYASGPDSVDALFQAARCREETGDRSGSALMYRNIWLNNPSSVQSKKSQEQLKELEKSGIKISVYTPEELLRRASMLASQNDFSGSLQTLRLIPGDVQPAAVVARIDLRAGINQYRLRNWAQAEKSLVKAAGSPLPGIRSEARFWLAKSLERQDQNERAFTLYMELAAEGKKQEYADDALIEAGGLRRSQGNYCDAARLFEQVVKGYPDSRFVSRAVWETGWCRYLAGEYGLAAESFKTLLKDETFREKVLYWLARTLEHSSKVESDSCYRSLQDEYPAGFYATWYRSQNGVKDLREPLGPRNALVELPQIAGFEKPRLLAGLGMMEESRSEMAAARKKAGDKKSLFPGLARVYLEIQDYSSAIVLFLQNRPVKWDRVSLPLWTAGYPRAYSEAISLHSAGNDLSDGLIYSLIRAESGFSPAIKSPAGAVGLMQLMPATAKATAREKGVFNPLQLTVPEYNIKLGTRHFRDLMKDYNGEVIYSIAAYNAGAAAVNRWRKSMKGLKMDEFIESIPYQETRDYVKKVYASAATYRQLYGLK
ncbi:MAG: transglycosylase SLT domain-containing protein [Desulfuromonadales bacterium]|nr:transglycosylase SLT domain-containing protein [Desulfuromonadales bacterium]